MQPEIFLSFDPLASKSGLQSRIKQVAYLAADELHQPIHPVTIVAQNKPLNAQELTRVQKALARGKLGKLRHATDSIEVLRSETSSINR